jgi:hypothetical protein
VPAPTFVAARNADALQVSHFGGVCGGKLLRIDTKCTEKFWQFVRGVRPFAHGKEQFLSGQSHITRYKCDLFLSKVRQFAP